ncbi:MAG: outer membrane protein assembly factor BamD [bacterium]
MATPGRKPRVLLALLVLALVLPCAAGNAEEKADAGPEKSGWEKFKSFFKGEKEIPPAEELFRQAEEFYHGRETWWGELVRKVHGKDSKAYRNWWGVKLENYTRAKELYQKLVDNYPYYKHTPIAELRLAGCAYELEEYQDASFQYEQFRLLHPTHEKVPFALFREAMCHYHQMLKPGRDQTETRKAIELFNKLLAEYPESGHEKKARQKRKECRLRIIKHEFRVAKFYFKRKEFWAAAGRYHGVWENYPGLGYDAEAMYKEGLCYENLDKTELAIEIYKRAVKADPGDEYAKKARTNLEELRTEEEG